jgi:uncharacterized alkaline shock family protein YloU
MNGLDRALLFLYSLAVALVALGVIFQAAGFDVLSRVPAPDSTVLLILALVFFLVSLRFLLMRLRPKERESVVQATEIGEIGISLQTMESLAERAVRTVRGVHDLNARVRITDAGVSVAVRITVLPDLEIPAMTEQIQSKVKEYIESMTGVAVERVKVLVSSVAPGHSPVRRVPRRVD